MTYSAAKCMQIYAEREFANIHLRVTPKQAPLSINYLNFIVLHYYLYQQQQRNEDNNFIPGKDSNVPIKQTPETRTNGEDERRGEKKEAKFKAFNLFESLDKRANDTFIHYVQ